MGDPRIDKLVGTVVDMLTDPKVCGYATNALRSQLKNRLRAAAGPEVPDSAIDLASRDAATVVRNACEGLSPGVRAVATVVVVAGAVYGVTQMPEADIRRLVSNARVKLGTDLGFLGADFRGTRLTVAPTLAPLFGGNVDVRVQVERQFRVQGFDATGSIYGSNTGTYGAEVSGRNSYGSTFSAGLNNESGGTVYFRLSIPLGR